MKSAAGSTTEEKANALKIAASASFVGPVAQGSVSASYEKKNDSKMTEQRVSFNKTMSWEAQGGNTLLCNR